MSQVATKIFWWLAIEPEVYLLNACEGETGSIMLVHGEAALDTVLERLMTLGYSEKSLEHLR